MVCFFSCGNPFQFFETFDIQNLSNKLNSHEPGLLNSLDRFFLTIIFQKLLRFSFEWSNLGNGTKNRPIIYGTFFCQNCQKLEKSHFSPKICQKKRSSETAVNEAQQFSCNFLWQSSPCQFFQRFVCLRRAFEKDFEDQGKLTFSN